MEKNVIAGFKELFQLWTPSLLSISSFDKIDLYLGLFNYIIDLPSALHSFTFVKS